MANSHRRRNCLSKIKVDGVWLTEEQEIKRGVVRAFKDQLTDPGGWHPSMEGLDFNRIGDEDATRLEEVFSEEEVLKALSDLNGDKVPGPDGFPLRFWQFCWDVVKEEIMGFLLEFHERSRFVRSLNSTFLVLIPKKVGAEDLRDFRPIGLVGGLYKLLAKVLANRLKKIVGKVVSSAQNAFVEGRQILDVALIANEAIDSLLKRNESGVLCKLDLEKAYDHINWNFLLFVLQSMGFGEKWTGWISWCISIATFSVLINGTPEGYFNSSRGLRQGDPLSPYLFVIGMEALSRLIHRAVGEGFLSGCRVNGRGGNGALVSHLLFADDTLVFCEASEDQMVHLSWLLMWFEAISGLRINLDKSEILSVGRVENLENLALEAGCKVGRLPSSYLGIPLGANHKSVAVWDGVEERFRKRLALWKRIYFQRRENYSNSEYIVKDFLWGGGALEKKPHLVNWDTVCMDKRKGGLGVRRLSILNRALLCKWNWRFAIERENFWRHVISRKFGEEEGGWSSREVKESYGVGFWKEIRKEGALMQNKVAFLVGNGRRKAWVEEFWDTSGGEGAWSPRFSKPFNDWEVEEVERLLLTIRGARLSPLMEDRMMWKCAFQSEFLCLGGFLGHYKAGLRMEIQLEMIAAHTYTVDDVYQLALKIEEGLKFRVSKRPVHKLGALSPTGQQANL
ncbi:LINE-1 retrotransposable element ORF2 protein [Vitis vinifera]|uniref:LINE-1 retrotransposable element ORF2 protein n=1 Tax=Vitis vinifera TaxID=29760 RepID=A0A438EEU2_VITVI|nr:LINE-1 retrotransposable element ORF2 protein [Vitis vinifera]